MSTMRFYDLGSPHLTLVRCGKVVNFDALADSLNFFLKHATRQPPHDVIVDLSDVEDMDLSFREIIRFLPFMKVVLADEKQSFSFLIAAPGGQHRAVAEVFSIVTRAMERLSVRVVPDLETALRRHGLPDLEFAKIARLSSMENERPFRASLRG